MMQRRVHIAARARSPVCDAPEERAPWGIATVLIRPVRPQDEALYRHFLAMLTPDDIRNRYSAMIPVLRHHDPARLAHPECAREIAFLALRGHGSGDDALMGEVRAVFDAGTRHADFAMVVRSDLKHRGLGMLLLSRLIRHCQDRDVDTLAGNATADNAAMLQLAKRCGFIVRRQGADDEIAMRLALSPRSLSG